MSQSKQKSYLGLILSKKIGFSCLLFCIVVMSGCKKPTLVDDVYSRPIRENIKSADKVIVTFNNSPDFYEFTGKHLYSLGETLEISTFEEGFDCLCYAEVIFYFYKGDDLQMVLGHHLNGTLRWFESDWDGDAKLSSESLRRLMKWRNDVLSVAEKLPRGAYKAPSLE
jgi:hypothetical protein